MTTKDAYSSQQMLPGTSVSFAELFSSHYKKLCLYAFQFIKDRDLVEDIVQDCFTKLWVKRDQLDFSNGISGYLYTMVRHGVYDFLREAGTHSPYYKAIELLADNSRTHELIVAETIQHIHQIKELLPPKCRDVFNLLFIEGKNNAETARELRITESTLRTQKAKALAFIRQRLNRLSALLIFFFAG